MRKRLIQIIYVIFVGSLFAFIWILIRPGQNISYSPNADKTSIVPETVISNIKETPLNDSDKEILFPEKQLAISSDYQDIDKPLGPSESLLEIQVICNETDQPLADARIDLNPDTEDIEGKKLFYKTLEEQEWCKINYIFGNSVFINWGIRSFTDKSGKASVRLPSGIPMEMQVLNDDIADFHINIKALQPKEIRKVVAKVGPILFYGLVVEKSSAQQTIAGAKVSEYAKRSNSTVTDSTGLFSLKVCSDHILISKEGYGLVLVSVDENHQTTDNAYIILLDKATTVYGHIYYSSVPASDVSVVFYTTADLISQGDDPCSIEPTHKLFQRF